MTDLDPPEPAVCGGLAQRLTVLALRHSQASQTFPVLRAEFQRHVDRVDEAHRRAEGLAEAGGALGAWLAEIGIAGDSPILAIGEAIGEAVLAAPAAWPPSDLVTLLASVSAGYGNAIREATFKQQEHIKRALVLAKMDAERELYASETRFGEVFASAAIGIAIIDLDGIVEQSNPALHRMVDRQEPEIHGTEVFELFVPAAALELRADFRALAEARAGGNRVTRAVQVLLPDTDTNWVELSIALLRDQSGAADHYAAIFTDVSDLYLLSQRLQQQTLHDMVTNRPNRQFLESRLGQVVEQGHNRHSFWLYHLDLDDFALHNEQFGRSVGDQLMRVVADRLAQFAIGRDDMLARAEGDQFLLLIEERGPGAEAISDEVLAAVNEPIDVHGSELRLTASIGVAGEDPVRALDHDGAVEALLLRADRALREARARGGAQAVLFKS